MSYWIWALFPPQHTTIDKGHGRIEERRIWTSTDLVGYETFPHSQQVFRIERIFKNLDGSLRSHDAVHGISSLSPKKASPRRLLELVRGHWKIESLHWVRDMIYDEDRSQVRKGQAPQLMATFRNVAISLLRFAGASSIASSVRHCARNLDTVLSLIGILPT